jgi:methanogenic corrinoid protein MtbC1
MRIDATTGEVTRAMVRGDAELEARKALLEELSQSVIAGDQTRAQAAAKDWLHRGWPAREAVWAGLVAGMRRVGQQFVRRECFLPQTLISAEVMYSGLDLLRPALLAELPPEAQGRVLMGAVAGDSYRLGETMIEILAEAGGFAVVRWGESSVAEHLAEELTEGAPRLIGIFPVTQANGELVKEVLRCLEARNRDLRIVIGGTVVECQAAAELVDRTNSHNARDALAQAVGLACSLVPEAQDY